MNQANDRAALIKKTIRGNFDRSAEKYSTFEASSSFFSKLALNLVSLGALPENPRVLDVGCGTGASMAAFGRTLKGKSLIVGMDLSLGMLKAARAALPDANLVCLDGCAYGEALKPGFDAVIYNAVLFMLPDAAESLECARKLLKPGGRVLAASLEKVTVGGEPVAEILAAEGHQAGRHSLSPSSVVESLLKEKFTGFESRNLERPLTGSLFMDFYGLEAMSFGLLPKTPYPERLRILEKLDARLKAEGKTPVQEWVLSTAVRA